MGLLKVYASFCELNISFYKTLTFRFADYKWFPKINTYNYEQKIFDECISFLESGRLPYYELNV